jgi:hypothetical protein
VPKRFHSRLLAGLIAAGALLVPSAAFGQTADQGAPTAGSPPANQYEIPLQAGRKDAAPPNAQGKGNSGSLYRSNNNFGSSSVIPGDPGSGGGGDGGAGGAGGTGDNPNGSASGPNSGSGSGSGNDSNGLDTGAPSELAAYTTIPLLVILGAVIGLAGVRMRRRAEV